MALSMKSRGFTLIELLVVIAIIGILASIIIASLGSARKNAYYTKAQAQFRSFSTALEIYLNESGGVYPADANRDIPAGLEEHLSSSGWPDAPWTGSVYDWDNWIDPSTGRDIYQLSIRFCPIGQPDECNFPDEDWAEDFDVNSSLYYCFEGACRAHINKPITHPGYCINCTVQPSG